MLITNDTPNSDCTNAYAVHYGMCAHCNGCRLNKKGEYNDMDKTIEKLIKEELERANKKFPLFASEHEGYAVMLEEFEEAQEEIEDIKSKLETLWHVTRNKNIEMGYRFFLVEHMKEITIRAIQELIQLAAMCDKYEVSLKDKE